MLKQLHPFLTLILFFIGTAIDSHAQCNPAFSSSVNYANVTLQPAQSGPSLKHKWYLGDGYVSTASALQYAYGQPGTYTIRHVVRDTVLNCADSATAQVTLSFVPSCGANILSWADSTTAGPLRNYFFYCQTQVVAGNQYTWKVDGAFASSAYSFTTALSAGTHTVCLKVTTAQCADSSCITVVVPPVTSCGSVPGFTQTAAGNGTVQFNTAAAAPGYQLKWSFGDGTSPLYGNSSVTHHYSAAGTYTATLYRYNPSINCIDSSSQAVTVQASACDAGFQQSVSGASATFTGVMTGAGVGHSWSFGDGSSGYGNPIIHNYPQGGTYIVKHIVHDSLSNCTDTLVKTIQVNVPTNCSVSLMVSADSSNPTQHQLVAMAVVPSGTVTSYLWTVNNAYWSTTVPFLHIALQPGTQTVCVKITTSNGCVSTACKTVTVAGTASCGLQPSFTYQATPGHPREIHFNPNPASATLIYKWNFGDGSASTVQNPVHQYPASATITTYTVRLTVKDSLGSCADSVYQLVNVWPDACLATFHYQLDSAQQGWFMAISSTVLSSQQFTIKKLYDSSAAVSVSGPGAHYTFSDTGFYRVCLAAVTASGCQSYYCDTIHVTATGGRPLNLVPAYPNPALGSVSFDVSLQVAGPIRLEVYSAGGLTVSARTQSGAAGNNRVTLPVGGLQKGQYFVRLQYGGQEGRAIFQKL